MLRLFTTMLGLLGPCHVLAAIAFVAVTETTDDNTTPNANYVFNLPSHTNGDALVCIVGTTDNTNNPLPSISTPSGWTAGPTGEAGDFSAVRLTTFVKEGNGSESTITVADPSNPSASIGHAMCAAYSGVDTSDIIDAQSTVTETDSTADVTAPAVTTTVADTMVIHAYIQDDDSATDADVDSDAGWNGTKRAFIADVSGPGNGLSMAYGDETQAGIGASNTSVFSMNGDTEAAVALSFSLTPTVSGTANLLSGKLGQKLKGKL